MYRTAVSPGIDQTASTDTTSGAPIMAPGRGVTRARALSPLSPLSRRDLLLAAPGAAASLVALTSAARHREALAGEGAPVRASRLLMGTRVDIGVAAPAGSAWSGARAREVAALVESAFGRMTALAASMSRFDDNSDLGLLSRNPGRQTALPAATLDVLQQALALSRRTSGAFDPTVGRLTTGPGGVAAGEIPDDALVRRALAHVGPNLLRVDAARGVAWLEDPATQLDLGGVAKLPILAAGLDVLARAGLPGVMINGGGDVLVSARDDRRPWRIGVRDALLPDRLIGVVPLVEGVVASSGDYERYVPLGTRRYHHVLDPATGRPTRGLHGVTLVARDVPAINGLGTAAMVVGPGRAAEALARWHPEGAALLMAEDGGTQASPGGGALLEPAPDSDHIRGLVA